jgi:hypothetical protein
LVGRRRLGFYNYQCGSDNHMGRMEQYYDNGRSYNNDKRR